MIEPTEEEPEVVIEDVLSCPKCQDGTLEFHDFIRTQLLICNNCDYREKAHGPKEETKNGRLNSATKAKGSQPVVAPKKRSKK